MRLLRAVSVAFLPLLLSGADYSLPGTADTSYGTDGSSDSGFRRVSRDSNGYWYVVWETSSQTDILMAYTTTTTPTAATDWKLLTLVDNGNTGAIANTPANNAGGMKPNIAITHDDQLYFAWKMVSGTQAGYYSSKCSNLTAVTTAANWSAPVRLDGASAQPTYPARLSLMLDENDALHAAFLQGSADVVSYAKYDTASAAWLTPKNLDATSAVEVALATDLDNNVYVTWMTYTSDIYLLASPDADTTAPTFSTWKNLAQTTTDADKVNNSFGAAYGGPDLIVDRNGVLHVAWDDASSFNFESRDGYLTDGWINLNTNVDTSNGKRCVQLLAAGDGNTRNFRALNAASTDDTQSTVYNANTAYRSPGAWVTAESDMNNEAADTTEEYMAEHMVWPSRTDFMYFKLDDVNNVIQTNWANRVTGTAGWAPPRPTKNVNHPHLTWIFPNTAKDLGALFLPVVSQTAKSSVYVADNLATGRIYALDRTLGTVARSYTLAGVGVQVIGATYAGNVHLFAQHNANAVIKFIDDGTAISYDAAWANNPLILGAAGVGTMLPPTFSIQSGVRYVYALADGAGVGGGLYKVKADNGVLLGGGWPFGDGTYQTNYLEPQFRFLNDQVFLAGNSTQLYRRESDGSAEIVSSSVANIILHLLQVKGSDNNRLFLAPEDQAVWILNSGLKTTDWTGGQSANLGVPKTSGAYYTRYRNAVLVGAGNQLYRLNVTDGTIWANWPMATVGNIVSLPVEWRTFVYFGTDSGRLYAVNATTNVHRPNWPVNLNTTVSTPKPRQIAFDALSGHVYFATDEGRVYKFATE